MNAATHADAEPMGALVVLRAAVAAAGVFLFFTALDDYLFSAYSGPGAAAWVAAFAFATAGLVLVAPRDRSSMPPMPLLAWIIGYLSLMTLWALFMQPWPEATKALIDRYKALLLLLTFAILFNEPRVRRVAVWALVAALVMGACLNLAEAAGAIRFEYLRADPFVDSLGRVGRAQGFYSHPNQSGQAIALGLAVAIPVIPKAWRVPLFLVGAAGVAPTFSRSAFVCLGMVFLYFLWRRALGASSLAILGVGVALIALLAVPYLDSHELLDDNTSGRLHFARDDSGRIELATKALGNFLSSPIVGNNVGSTSTLSPGGMGAHNMFLTLASDYGFLGLLILPALSLALFRSHRGAACFALLFVVVGVFTHMLLTERSALLCAALAAVPAKRDARAEAITEEG